MIDLGKFYAVISSYLFSTTNDAKFFVLKRTLNLFCAIQNSFGKKDILYMKISKKLKNLPKKFDKNTKITLKKIYV